MPDLASRKRKKPIGLWGQRHKRYLQEHKRAFYATLLTSGKLNVYLANVDKQAEKRFERFVEQMKQAQGITERLKAKNALEVWISGQMNNIRACAMEIVEREIIFAISRQGGREYILCRLFLLYFRYET